MAEQFPRIKPTTRAFKLGTFPVKTYRALSGATVKRAFGSRPSGFELQLGFDNIPDATTEQLLAHYNGSSGGFDRFTLPADLFAGMTTTLRGYIQAPTSIRWEYAGPPEVQSVYTGRSRVSITLIGELDF
jgi:hypothetical protein